MDGPLPSPSHRRGGAGGWMAGLPSPTPVHVKGLTGDEIAELREIFRLVDKDGDGSISKTELSVLLHTLGIRIHDDELDGMMKEVDSDGNGEIEFREFLHAMERRMNIPYTVDEVIGAFRVFETPSCPPGHLLVSELMSTLMAYTVPSGPGSTPAAGGHAGDGVRAASRQAGTPSHAGGGSKEEAEAGITDEQLRHIVSQLTSEADAAGVVNYVDFVHMMMDR